MPPEDDDVKVKPSKLTEDENNKLKDLHEDMAALEAKEQQVIKAAETVSNNPDAEEPKRKLQDIIDDYKKKYDDLKGKIDGIRRGSNSDPMQQLMDFVNAQLTLRQNGVRTSLFDLVFNTRESVKQWTEGAAYRGAAALQSAQGGKEALKNSIVGAPLYYAGAGVYHAPGALSGAASAFKQKMTDMGAYLTGSNKRKAEDKENEALNNKRTRVSI